MGIRFVLGLLLSSWIAVLAFRKRSLTKDGMVAAMLVGTVIFTFGSLYWYGLLLSFFLSSSFWSNYRKRQKRKVEDLFAKTGQRDALQVLANGGIAMLITVMQFYFPSMLWFILFLGVMSTVNADTWGTEIGILSTALPRHILTWTTVEKGTSGGVSMLGMTGTVSGAFTIGAAACVLYYFEEHSFRTALVGVSLVAGVGGALVDSVLGATIQKMYFCQKCGQSTEKSFHCGATTSWIRGIRWCNNDVVNLLSSVTGGLLAVGVYYLSR